MESLTNYVENEKIANLGEVLVRYGSLLVAFSGGVDSGFLLKAAVDFLGQRQVLAVTYTGSTQRQIDLEDARQTANQLEADWKEINTSMLDNPDFVSNPPNRCYYCKQVLFTRLKSIAGEVNLNEVADGTTDDDLAKDRPGMLAATELDIKSPLKQVGITKPEIRKFACKVGLPLWKKPSNTCLATRIPHGSKITEEKLRQVEKSESHLQALGFRGFRVRHHGEVARLELQSSDLSRAFTKSEQIVKQLKDVGYRYVTLDLEEYRSGSLSETMDPNQDSKRFQKGD